MTVSRDRRITFRLPDGDAVEVDREDYHGWQARRPETSHPGGLLREMVLPGLEQSKTEIAHLLEISRGTRYQILDEKQPVTPTMAARLGKLVGDGPGLWLRRPADCNS